MTPQAAKLLGAIRRNFELLVELEKESPADVEQILVALIAHVRSWKPQVLLQMETP